MKNKLSKILGIGLSIALVTSLLLAAVPAVALTQPTVTVAPTTISAENADYVIIFNISKMLTATDTITITFPSGTAVTSPIPAGSVIAATDGWDTSNASNPQYLPANVGGVTWVSDATLRTVTATLQAGNFIGEGAQVRIALPNGIKNPGTPGMYTLTVKTSKETTAVTSAEYEIKTPTIDPLSGIVMGYNEAGILMAQSHTINDCIVAAGPKGRVEIGPGTYTDIAGQIIANQNGQTIVGTGAPGTVIIKTATPFLVSGNDVTVDGLTFSPGGADPLVQVTGDRATITNSALSAGTAFSLPVTELIWITPTGDNTTISNSTFDTTKTGMQTGIEIDAGKAKVTDSTFNVNSTDEAMDVMGNTAISGVTVTGSSGIGVYVEPGMVVTIDDSTFMTLTTAIDNNGSEVTISNSVIDGCGSSTVGGGAAIESASKLRMYNTTVQNTHANNYAFNLGAGADAEVHFNNILNNAKNVQATSTANFSHNWWGSADGPAAGSYSVPAVKITPVLGNSVTAASFALGKSSLTAKTAVGMDVAIITGNANIIGVAKYSANPELTPPSIMGTGKVIGYYDLYAAGVPANQIVQVKFYVPVTNYTKLYYAGGISGRWSPVENAGVNLASGFLYADIGGVTGGLAVADLGGTVFAVVEDKTTTAGPSIATGVGAPLIGSYDVSIEPMFTWGTVPGSIRYEIALSEDPTFTIIEWSYNVDQNFYKVDEALRYDTTYYWRVRGVLGEPYQEAGQWKTPATPWTVGIFTTESEPLPPPEPIVVQPTKPEVNVEIPPTRITIEPAEQAIPNYMLWIIVAVGAILVIALIVLIVRTRRVV